MIILTSANIDNATGKYNDEYGIWYRNFSFKSVINDTVKKARECGYTPAVYDLGNLGMGEPFYIEDETFAQKGYYSLEIQKGYRSRSLFKPDLVHHCLKQYNEFTVYMDGDAQLVGCLDEVDSGDYDIGVSLRKPSELESEWYKQYQEIAKYVNAGVIFFYPTEATFNFISLWHKKTQELANDQKALNHLVCPDYYPAANSIISVNGAKIKFFPCEKYNYYYFRERLYRNVKILHFKGEVRRYYPFDWKKRLYCMTINPLKNRISSIINRIF